MPTSSSWSTPLLVIDNKSYNSSVFKPTKCLPHLPGLPHDQLWVEAMMLSGKCRHNKVQGEERRDPSIQAHPKNLWKLKYWFSNYTNKSSLLMISFRYGFQCYSDLNFCKKNNFDQTTRMNKIKNLERHKEVF